MRNVILKRLPAACAAVLMAVSAQAADLPVGPPETPVHVPALEWSGIHIGIHAGYGWGASDFAAEKECPKKPLGIGKPCKSWQGEGSFDMEGFLAGGQIGYDYQIGSLVIGAEADMSWSGLDGDTFFGGQGRVKFAEPMQEIDWLATIRGRIGVAFDGVLIYGTGGAAFAGVETGLAFQEARFRDDAMRIGWTVGAGVEAFVTRNLTARIEYLYVDLGDADHKFPKLGDASITGGTDLTTHVVRGALTYKFGR